MNYDLCLQVAPGGYDRTWDLQIFLDWRTHNIYIIRSIHRTHRCDFVRLQRSDQVKLYTDDNEKILYYIIDSLILYNLRPTCRTS